MPTKEHFHIQSSFNFRGEQATASSSSARRVVFTSKGIYEQGFLWKILNFVVLNCFHTKYLKFSLICICMQFYIVLEKDQTISTWLILLEMRHHQLNAREVAAVATQMFVALLQSFQVRFK